MVAHLAARLAGIDLWGTPVVSSIRLSALLILSVNLLGACTVAASKDAVPHPADARVPVPRARYQSVTRGYESARPVEPQPWRERNERVAPEVQR
jgi:hypothetical protein